MAMITLSSRLDMTSLEEVLVQNVMDKSYFYSLSIHSPNPIKGQEKLRF